MRQISSGRRSLQMLDVESNKSAMQLELLLSDSDIDFESEVLLEPPEYALHVCKSVNIEPANKEKA